MAGNGADFLEVGASLQQSLVATECLGLNYSTKYKLDLLHRRSTSQLERGFILFTKQNPRPFHDMYAYVHIISVVMTGLLGITSLVIRERVGSSPSRMSLFRHDCELCSKQKNVKKTRMLPVFESRTKRTAISNKVGAFQIKGRI